MENSDEMDSYNEDNIGKIYCMINSNIPKFVKVGFTTREELELREKEISRATGVPGNYETYCFIKVDNVRFYETMVHQELVKRGFERDQKKELFKCSPEDVEKVFADFCKKKVYKPEKKEMETVNDIKDSITKENSNEDKDENKVIEIKTFKEYLEKSEEAAKYYKKYHWYMKDIVITNKSKFSGYYRSVNQKFWKSIFSKTEDEFPLLELFDNTGFGKIESNNFGEVEFKFGNAIIKDVIKNYYIKDFKFDTLNYHQFIVSDKEFLIVNLLDKTIKNLENLNFHFNIHYHNNIIPSKEDVENFKEVIKNCDMIDNLKEFKELCYSLFVENKNIEYCTDTLELFYFLGNVCEKLYSYNSVKKFINPFFKIDNINQLNCENFDNERLILVDLYYDNKTSIAIDKKYKGNKNFIHRSKIIGRSQKLTEAEKFIGKQENFLTVVFWAANFYE